MTAKFKGIIPPLVTPLKDNFKLDAEGLDRLLEHLVAGGVHGVFLLGTTGEAPSLGRSLKYELVERACATLRGRIPALVGITDTAFSESLELAEHAAKCGASALVLAPPYYFRAGQEELLEYLGHLVPRLPLPLMLYNMPSLTKLEFEPRTVAQALKMPGVVGLKDSSGSMVYFHKLKEIFTEHPEASLLIGPEELLAESLIFGSDGGICGGANIFPKLYVKLYERALAGDFKGCLEMHSHVMAVGRALYGLGRHPSSAMKGIKCALSICGVCDDFMAEPFHRYKEAERKGVEKALASLKESLACL